MSGTREQPVQIQSIIHKSTALLMNNPFILQAYDSTAHDKCMSVCALCNICFKRLTPVFCFLGGLAICGSFWFVCSLTSITEKHICLLNMFVIILLLCFESEML